MRGANNARLNIETTRQQMVKGMPTVPMNSPSLESGADRIWGSSDLPADDTCCTLKPTMAKTMPTVRTTAVEAPSFEAAMLAAPRQPAQARPAMSPAGARSASTGLLRATGRSRRIRHNALARKSVQAPLEIIDPPLHTGHSQERLFDAARPVTLTQQIRASVRNEPTLVEEIQLVAHALGEGEILGREQNRGTGTANVSHEPQQNHYPFGIQTHRGFVDQDRRHVQRQGGGRGDLATDAVRELAEAGLAVLQKSEGLEYDPGPFLVPVRPLAIQVPVELQVLAHAEMLETARSIGDEAEAALHVQSGNNGIVT